MPEVVTTIAALRRRVASARELAIREGSSDAPVSRVVLVPTMGALHEGHLQLVRQARDLGGIVVVSIFVNPLQFAPGEDLDRYPRTLDADLQRLDGIADIVFAPTVDEMYPSGSVETRVSAGSTASLYEGASRPGHFDGMLTVVAKLFHIVAPDVAVFGQKDAQQVNLVGRMVRDLDLPITIAVVDTVRETDGLALSSRNRYLDPAGRAAAVALSSALTAGSGVAASGPDAVLEAARAVIAAEPAVKLDYLVVVDPETFLPVGEGHHGPAIVLIAARVGSTRLIDNERITFP
jgi:pantoate--beta-alanine ligase